MILWHVFHATDCKTKQLFYIIAFSFSSRFISPPPPKVPLFNVEWERASASLRHRLWVMDAVGKQGAASRRQGGSWLLVRVKMKSSVQDIRFLFQVLSDSVETTALIYHRHQKHIDRLAQAQTLALVRVLPELQITLSAAGKTTTLQCPTLKHVCKTGGLQEIQEDCVTKKPTVSSTSIVQLSSVVTCQSYKRIWQVTFFFWPQMGSDCEKPICGLTSR